MHRRPRCLHDTAAWPRLAGEWLERVDPGAHGRIKGLRLVTAYGIAAMLGTMPEIVGRLPDGSALSALAGGFALWGSVSESRRERVQSTRDLLLLALAAALGASLFVLAAPLAGRIGIMPESVLVSGAFCVGYLRRFGVTGTGAGSQIYIGQLLAYDGRLTVASVPTIAVAAAIAAIATIVPRLLSGPAEHPPPVITLPQRRGPIRTELAMGLQAGVAALSVVILNAVFGLVESAWGITACAYVITGSAVGTVARVRRRIAGTMVGVPLGLACLPLAQAAPLALWTAAAAAMVIYAVALPRRYDIACAAYAFVLVLTLAVDGVHSMSVLLARLWETLLGGTLGLAAAMTLFPVPAGSEA